MDHTTPGKRLAPKNSAPSGARIAVVIAAVLLAVLIGGYAALCALAGRGGRLYPNTSIQAVNVSRMPPQEARAALDRAWNSAVSGTVVLSLSDGSATVELGADLAALQGLDELLPTLSPATDGTPFYLRGLRYVQSFFSPRNVILPVALTGDGAARLEEAAGRLAAQADRPLAAPSWSKDGDSVTLRKGSTGQSADTGSIRADVEAALSLTDLRFPLASFNITVELVQAPPPELDLEDIARQLFVAPVDARLDPEAKTILPSSPGVRLDAEAARALLADLPEGGECTLPLTPLEPEIHADDLDKLYYQDLLASAESKVTGTSARISNVNVGRKYIDGAVLLPGETFSYMALVAPYSAARGFKPAPVYAGGGSRDELGGGLCQVSSTLYLACLRADLEIVERHQQIGRAHV